MGEIRNIETDHGQLIYFTAVDAAYAVARSTAKIEAAFADRQQKQAEALLSKLGPDTLELPVVTGAVIASAVAATAVTGAGLAIGAAGSAAAIASAGADLAGLFAGGDGSGSPAATFEFRAHNSTVTPVIYYGAGNGGCSIASSMAPMMPGGQSSLSIVQPNGFSGGSSGSWIQLGFFVGSGENNNGNVSGVRCNVSFHYNENNDWQPFFAIDDKSGLTNQENGLTAVTYIPNDISRGTGFTIASYLVQKGTGEVDILFLPPSDVG